MHIQSTHLGTPLVSLVICISKRTSLYKSQASNLGESFLYLAILFIPKYGTWSG